MMAMAEPSRLSQSMDNLASEELTVTLPDTEMLSKSMDDLAEDSYGTVSMELYGKADMDVFDKGSVELDAFYDDDDEEESGRTEDEGRMEEDMLPQTESEDELLGSLTELPKSLVNMDDALSGLIGPVDDSASMDGLLDPMDTIDPSETSVIESKISSKRDNVINTMLVLDGKEKSVLHKHWDDVTIDKDIQMSVNQFTKSFFENYLNRACNDEKILLVKALHEQALKAEIGKWLSAKLQIERDGWSLKIKAALKEVEDNRKSALRAAALSQACSEQLRLLLECFNVNDDVMESIPISNSAQTIQRCLELLVEICNALMEDRFQCMHLLQMEDEGGVLAESLSLRLRGMEERYARDVDAAREEQRQAESENLKLLKEVVRMKKVLSQKQQDVEWLRRQMADINDIVSKQVKRVDKSTSTDPSPGDNKKSKLRQQRPATETITSIKQVGTKARPATELINSGQPRETSIHISQEKLLQLKQRAKKLEDSLHDAIASMDKLRKTTGPVTNSNNKDLPTDLELAPLVLNNTFLPGEGPQGTGGVNSKKDWERASFEIKGGPTARGFTAQKTVPKLNLKHSQRNIEKKSVSDRTSSKDAFREVELKKTVELSATLAQLKAFKPQAGKVSKCFRCQKLFRQIDNHKRACLYHPKKKERVERYTEGGQLLKVVYLWTCCKQDLDMEGCTYGQHV